MRLGVLDIGSNTVHLLVVDAHQGAAPLPAWKSKIALRLAEHLGPDGRIDDDAVDDLVAFACRAQETAEDLGVTEFLAFATSAIRDAPNGLDVIGAVRERAGLDVEVLSGSDEARLTFLAVRRWFGWSAGRILVLDIGGGSLELATGADEEPDVALSLPLGAGRFTREYLRGDPPDDSQVRQARKEARAALGEVVGQILRAGEPRITVATSKTFRQLARIAGAAPSRSVAAASAPGSGWITGWEMVGRFDSVWLTAGVRLSAAAPEPSALAMIIKVVAATARTLARLSLVLFRMLRIRPSYWAVDEPDAGWDGGGKTWIQLPPAEKPAGCPPSAC